MEMTFINICKIYKQFKWVFGFITMVPLGGVGHLALGVIPRLTSSSLCVCVCVCVCIVSIKPLDVGTTKIRYPKVGAIFAI